MNARTRGRIPTVATHGRKGMASAQGMGVVNGREAVTLPGGGG